MWECVEDSGGMVRGKGRTRWYDMEVVMADRGSGRWLEVVMIASRISGKWLELVVV